MKPDDDRRLIRFDDLNVFGKAVYLGGATVRGVAGLIDLALEKAAGVVVDAEEAFRKELDPNLEDAKILEEHDREPPAPRPRRDDAR